MLLAEVSIKQHVLLDEQSDVVGSLLEELAEVIIYSEHLVVAVKQVLVYLLVVRNVIVLIR